MNLEKEVDYRLTRWLLSNLYHSHRINKRTFLRLQKNLLKEEQPPFASIEVIGGGEPHGADHHENRKADSAET